MAEQEYVVNSSFLLKRGFAKDWEKLNPLLKQGEIGFILDQNAIKIGDGVTLWNALPIVGDDEFGKFESRIREELEKGWKKPVRFTKSVAIGSAEASGEGSFAMGKYRPFSVKNGWGSDYLEKSDIRRLTKEEAERLYEYTGVYYEYVSLSDNIDDESLQQAIYFVDTEQLVHITESVYIDWHLDDDEEGDSRSYDFFNIREGEVIDTDYTGPIVYLDASTDYCESDIRSLTEDEQNVIFGKTGTIYQYIDQSGSMPEEQYITISRPIGKTIHVTESEYVEIEDEFNGSDLVKGDVFNIAEGENIETPCYAYGCEYIKDDYDHHRYYRFYRLTSTARELVYNKTGKYYEYIDRQDSIEDGKAPTIELYDIERYGHVVAQSEYIQTSDGFPVTGLVFNIKDNIGFKAPYKGIMLYNYCPVEMGIDLENYEPTAVASGRLAFAQGDHVIASGNYSHAEGNYTIASGSNSHAEGSYTTASGPASHTEGYNTKATNESAHAEGYSTTASGYYSHAEGYSTAASGGQSHAEGNSTTASGNCSHAEGYNTKATKSYAHAEGSSTTASGQYSHAEGQNTTASGGTSHAEGGSTIASSNFSHAEGFSTKASGAHSHAEGAGTIAAGEAQHAQGRYNIEDTENKHAFIIGNGEDANNRSNAFTVDWNGDAKLDGYLNVKGISTSAVTRDLYIGGAKSYNGYNWIPDGYVVVDDTEEYTGPTTKNSAYITTLKAPKAGSYFLALEEGSNYLFKIQVTDSSTHILNVSTTIPEFASGAKYNGQTEAFNGFTIHYAHKTKVDASTKTFSDGYVGSRRLNFQKETIFREGSRTVTYPGIQFSTDSAADVKIWWVAGDANRHFSLLDLDRGGRARLGVSGTLELHGEVEAEDSTFRMAHLEVSEEAHIGGSFTAGKNVEIGDSLRVDNDLIVGGFISCGESLDMNGNDIKNAQTITVKGTSTLLGDVKIKNNANRDKYDATKLRDVLDEALDFDFKKRILFNGIELRDLGAQHGSLKSHIDVMRDTSATTLTFSEEEYTFDIGDEPIEIWKDLTLKGVSEKPVVLKFNYIGTADSFTVFKVMAPDLNIGFENVDIQIDNSNIEYDDEVCLFDNNEQSGTNITIKRSIIELYGYITDYDDDTPKWKLNNANLVRIEQSELSGQKFYGTVNCFYCQNDSAGEAGAFENLEIEYEGNTCGANINGSRCIAIGIGSNAEGYDSRATAGDALEGGDSDGFKPGGSHAEGYSTKASGAHSHAEGAGTKASGRESHAEGGWTTASSYGSHAEGYNTTASGWYSHAEGYKTTTSGRYSHAEGEQTTASGQYSHAEGKETTAIGEHSHAEGYSTIANGKWSHAEGCSNVFGQLKISGDSNTTTYASSNLFTYTVEDVEGKTNGFALTDSGWYESQNKEASSQAWCKVNFIVPTMLDIVLDLETSGYDCHSKFYKLDSTLGNLSIKYQTQEGKHRVSYSQVPPGNHHIYISFANDRYASSYNRLKFKLDGVSGNGPIEQIVGMGVRLGETVAKITSVSPLDGTFTVNKTLSANAITDVAVQLGCLSVSDGIAAHTTGFGSAAWGDYSSAEGEGTITSSNNQHAQGKYNIEDTENTYAHIVGNGSSLARSNAHTLNWDGTAWFAGDVYTGSTSGTNKDEGSKKLATEDFVNTSLQKIETALGSYITDIAALVGGDA